MTVMSTGLFPQDLRPGIKKWFGENTNWNPLFSQIFKVLKDDRAYVEDALLSGLGLLQVKDQGQAIRYDAGKQGYTPRYDHFTMALGFQITWEMMSDGIALRNAEIFSKKLRNSANQSDEVIAHQVLNRGFDTNFTMTNGDGKPLFSATHPIRGNGSTTTLSNLLAVAADLSETSLEQATIDINNFVDDRGLKQHIRPTTLVVNVANQFEAHRILKSQLRVGTADNDTNALRDMGTISKIVVTPFTSDTDAWFLVTDAEDGLKFFDRSPASIDHDSDFDNGSGKFKVMRRLSVGWSDPRGAYGSPGA